MKSVLKILVFVSYIILGVYVAYQFRGLILPTLLTCAVTGIGGGFLAIVLFEEK